MTITLKALTDTVNEFFMCKVGTGVKFSGTEELLSVMNKNELFTNDAKEKIRYDIDDLFDDGSDGLGSVSIKKIRVDMKRDDDNLYSLSLAMGTKLLGIVAVVNTSTASDTPIKSGLSFEEAQSCLDSISNTIKKGRDPDLDPEPKSAFAAVEYKR